MADNKKPTKINKSYDELTIKQQRFVDYYDGNATQAAEKAGFSKPNVQGARLLKNVSIHRALKTRENRRRKGHIWTREERQRFWTRVASGEETQPAVTGTDAEGNSIVSNIPPKMPDRLKASELLGRSEADFIDKMALGGIDPDGEITDFSTIPIVFVSAPVLCVE
uniref:Putative terminase n=1 Tax=viral metagenome TaxID=1070528 RepID=A0A6M3LEV8_9ZZZZ